MRYRAIAPFTLALLLAGCGGNADLDIAQTIGPNPTLSKPSSSWLPTVKVAEAVGWKQGELPAVAQGLAVTEFAGGLDHPREMLVLANGDVLVVETNAPPKPEDKKGGVKAWFQNLFMKKAGARVPSANRISLLRDADGDGRAELRTVLIGNLFSPYGMALVGPTLYIADADKVIRVPFTPGQTKIDTAPEKVVDLPGGRNHHWTKNMVASADGSKLYVSVGSNSNIAEHGMAEEEGRAAIWEIDAATGRHRIFAGGLRNPVGMDWEPASGRLWTVVNERDEIGGDLPPDYLTSVQFGGFYGWPWTYWNGIVDERVEHPRPAALSVVNKPDYALGAHTASLGLTFSDGARLGPQFATGAFVGQHGSWNRSPVSGYKVIFVPFAANGRPTGAKPVDVLTGFLDDEGKARGRPVGVKIDGRGGLLVADDVGNKIWRVAPAVATASR